MTRRKSLPKSPRPTQSRADETKKAEWAPKVKEEELDCFSCPF
jgi:hypothetical protein